MPNWKRGISTLNAGVEINHMSSEQAGEALTGASDGLDRTRGYSPAQARLMNDMCIAWREECNSESRMRKRRGHVAYRISEDKQAGATQIFGDYDRRYREGSPRLNERGRCLRSEWWTSKHKDTQLSLHYESS